MLYVWLIALVAFLVIEAITPSFVSLWFAGGALFALVAKMLGAPLWLQLTVFIISSAILLAATRPLYEKYFGNKVIPTNTDLLIGQTAVVTVPIDNDNAIGQVKVTGQVWSAMTEDGSTAAEGEKLTVVRVQGVRLIVKR